MITTLNSKKNQYPNRKILFYENAHKEMVLTASKKRISFYEGLAILISKAYIEPQNSKEPTYGFIV